MRADDRVRRQPELHHRWDSLLLVWSPLVTDEGSRLLWSERSCPALHLR